MAYKYPDIDNLNELENEKNKLSPKLDKLRLKEENLELRIEKLKKKHRVIAQSRWEISERIAGLNGHIRKFEVTNDGI